jgi:hypothetical protein
MEPLITERPIDTMEMNILLSLDGEKYQMMRLLFHELTDKTNFDLNDPRRVKIVFEFIEWQMFKIDEDRARLKYDYDGMPSR